MNGPRWIKQWISDMAALNEQFRNDDGLVDFEALGREEYSFRVALITKKFGKSERAMEIYRVAKIAYDSSVENGKKGGRPKKSPQDAPNGNAGDELSDAGNGAASKSPTSCETFTAYGDTREDSQAKTDGSAITRNETRANDALDSYANHYTADASEGDGEVNPDGQQATQAEAGTSANLYATRQAKNGEAATREGAEVVYSRESGAAAPTTFSRNMRQPAKTRDTSESCRYAPPSCSPDYGNPADTAPSHGGSVASLEARESQARQSQRREGENSIRVAKVSTSPSRSAGPMPADKQAIYDFAASEGLDTADAYECWHATVNERGGLTADGKPIKNWKAYVRKWCETRASRRNQ